MKEKREILLKAGEKEIFFSSPSSSLCSSSGSHRKNPEKKIKTLQLLSPK
jgi:hypothetical protein